MHILVWGPGETSLVITDYITAVFSHQRARYFIPWLVYCRTFVYNCAASRPIRTSEDKIMHA